MYKNFYGLRDKPFSLTPDPEYLYLGDHHKRALNFLHENIRKDFNLIALSGVIGSGKTILLRSFLKEMDNHTKVVQIFYPTSSNVQLLQMILLNIGIKTIHEDLSLLRNELTNQFNSLFQSYKYILLIIDEAQNLQREALDEVYRIIEPQANMKPAKALLVGLPDLLPNLSGLKTKTHFSSTVYNISNLPVEEISSYINSRLAIAGRSDTTIFPQETVSEISIASSGVPRVINIICESALTQGYLSGSRTITLSIIKEVLKNLQEIIGPHEVSHDASGSDSALESLIKGKGNDDTQISDVTRQEPAPDRLVLPESLSLKLYSLEKNARMRMHLADHLDKLGYDAVITDSFKSLMTALDIRSKWELQVIVMDSAFLLSASGKEDPAGWSALDRLQTTYAHAPIIITSILPLSSVREALFNRGISYLLKKPDLARIDLSALKKSVDIFINELQNILANIRSQYNSFFRETIKWSIYGN